MKFSIFDHPLITQRYFYPMEVNFDNPCMVKVKDAELGCYYLNKFPGAKTIVLFHGNGEVVADYINLYVPLFESLGCNCFLVEYRGYGMSSGTPLLGTALKDTEEILKFLNLPPNDIVLFGRSLGSLYALEAIKLIPKIGGLIIESGIANILERLLLRVLPVDIGLSMEQLQEAVTQLFNHQKKLAGFKGQTLIMHAENDTLVGSHHGRQLYHWAPPPKILKLFEKGDHNSIFMENQEEYLELLMQFISGLTS